MDIINEPKTAQDSKVLNTNNQNNRVVVGILCVLIGVVWLLRKAGVEFPEWMYSWGMILTVVGIIGGIANKLKVGAWLIPLILGVLFLIDDFYPLYHLWKYMLPVLLIGLGVVLIFKKKP